MSSASTGGTEGSSPASSPASAASLTMAAPKYGTLVPNRIFVGGISASTSEAELAQLFSAYGNVKATKIISDRAGVSKGYGFVTFETEEEAKRLQQESECIVLRERKLNIAPAIKKQPFTRSFDGGSGSPPSVPTSTYYYTNGMGLAYQNGMTFYNTAAPAPATSIAPPTDPGTIYQATGVFGPQAATGHQTFAPVMYPCPAPSLYMPQQYQYSPMPYEPYYAGAAAAGAPQYLYATGSSQSNTNGGGNSSGSGNNAGPPPPPPPHAPMGLTEQQLLLYATDASCQQTTTSDGQAVTQEDSRPTPSHSEQPHGEAQAASGSAATPLVSLMPVKFPVSSSRYTNYQPIAIHAATAANMHGAQNCTNDTDDCAAAAAAAAAANANAPMHCRTILYHPATLYIPHTHAPPPYHNASGTPSLLPTPFSTTSSHQSSYDTNTKTHIHHNSRDCGGSKHAGVTSGQGGNYSKGGQQNHGYHPLTHHQNSHAKSSHHAQGASQSHNNHNKYNSNGATDGSHKFTTITMSSRLPVPYNKRMAGSNVGTPTACFLKSGGGYGSNQATHRVNLATAANYGAHNKPTGYVNSNIHGYEHATNGRKSYGGGGGDDQTYYEIGASKSSMSGSYGMGRKSCLSNNNSYGRGGGGGGGGGGGARLDALVNDSNGRSNNDAGYDAAPQAVDGVATTLSTHSSSAGGTGADAPRDAQEKPATSPPPAPYSPMTRPLPTISPPTPQVQFYSTPAAQSRYQQPPSQSQHHQHQQQQSTGNNQQRGRYSVGQALSSANRKPSDKYSSTGSQTTAMLRQSKYKMNGIMQATATAASKLTDDNLGGAGDGPTATTVNRLPITPPGTPRGHSAAGDQLSDTCHQMQALTL